MGTDIEVTEEEVELARIGIRMQFDRIELTSEAREAMNEFLENQAQVIAHLHADVRRLDKIIHNVQEATIKRVKHYYLDNATDGCSAAGFERAVRGLKND